MHGFIMATTLIMRGGQRWLKKGLMTSIYVWRQKWIKKDKLRAPMGILRDDGGVHY